MTASPVTREAQSHLFECIPVSFTTGPHLCLLSLCFHTTIHFIKLFLSPLHSLPTYKGSNCGTAFCCGAECFIACRLRYFAHVLQAHLSLELKDLYLLPLVPAGWPRVVGLSREISGVMRRRDSGTSMSNCVFILLSNGNAQCF